MCRPIDQQRVSIDVPQFAHDKFLINCLLVSMVVAVYSPMAKAASIIVNQTVPVAHYSLADARAIFTMQQRFWPDGEPIKVFVFADNNPIHKDFAKNNLNMFPHQLRRVWDRMVYSGTGTAPVQLDSEQEMIDKIAHTPYSIGYANGSPNNENIRVFELR
ncbi:MAG: hypothetical protein Q7U57_02170 [Methylovulum sp.]|nr:hypothetical protein [Methylovulum sp.]